MPTIPLFLDEKLDEKLKIYMAKKNIRNKVQAITEILKKEFRWIADAEIKW